MKFECQIKYGYLPYVTRYEMEGEDKEKGKHTTVRTSGCGLCSAVMVADRLIPDSEFGIKEAVKMSVGCEANHLRGTHYKRFAPVFAKELNLDLEMTNDPERLRYCLRTGGAAVLHINGDREGYTGVFSHGGHYVVAISEERDGRIAILDPSFAGGKYEEEGRQGLVEVKYDSLAVCDMKVIEEDTLPKDPGFYLFWRK